MNSRMALANLAKSSDNICHPQTTSSFFFFFKNPKRTAAEVEIEEWKRNVVVIGVRRGLPGLWGSEANRPGDSVPYSAQSSVSHSVGYLFFIINKRSLVLVDCLGDGCVLFQSVSRLSYKMHCTVE